MVDVLDLTKEQDRCNISIYDTSSDDIAIVDVTVDDIEWRG